MTEEHFTRTGARPKAALGEGHNTTARRKSITTSRKRTSNTRKASMTVSRFDFHIVRCVFGVYKPFCGFVRIARSSRHFGRPVRVLGKSSLKVHTFIPLPLLHQSVFRTIQYNQSRLLLQWHPENLVPTRISVILILDLGVRHGRILDSFSSRLFYSIAMGDPLGVLRSLYSSWRFQ